MEILTRTEIKNNYNNYNNYNNKDKDTLSEAILNSFDAERLIGNLKCHPIENVGLKIWHDQRQVIEKLNIQAHFNAQNHSDEFIVQSLKLNNKIEILIHELLIIETWKDKLFPLLKNHLAYNIDMSLWYFILYHEVTLSNLLEICFFDNDCISTLDGDYLIELCDWCQRKFMYLNHHSHQQKDLIDLDLKQVLNQDLKEDLQSKFNEISFCSATCSVTILRYITENLMHLPLSIGNRLVKVNDIVMSLIMLLDQNPWIRTNHKIEKFINNEWKQVNDEDKFLITQIEGQVWLTLNNILLDANCRSKYVLDEYRREKILTIRKYFNEFLFDQLPVLKDLERVLINISLGAATVDNDIIKKSSLVIEQVPNILLKIRKNKDWKKIAKEQEIINFGKENCHRVRREHVEKLAEIFDYMCGMEDKNEKELSIINDKKVYIETRNQIKEDKEEWERISDYIFEIIHEMDKINIEDNNNNKIFGKRFRLNKMDSTDVPLFPIKGKIIVTFRKKKIESFFELPAPETKKIKVNEFIWIKVGDLKVDGYVLQLKLKRYEAKIERDNNTGHWRVYRPILGAITLLDEEAMAREAQPLNF